MNKKRRDSPIPANQIRVSIRIVVQDSLLLKRRKKERSSTIERISLHNDGNDFDIGHPTIYLFFRELDEVDIGGGRDNTNVHSGIFNPFITILVMINWTLEFFFTDLVWFGCHISRGNMRIQI
ncbi:hypothetical protein DERP_009334 [Dermatophagoides pteronyssinus]|uniref:Uncharacterized protein n=1 Tax=Dermatophagoides pteronyssinus TaxID=6956 RepID=A0ABQ8ITJ0_DERPT|nr:hypothetical protein DERP_009334 [Dermatophagoides pteronyssinus]